MLNSVCIRNYLREKLMIKPPVKGDPRSLNPRFKYMIISCASIVACTSGVTSTIYFPGIPYITRDLNAEPIETTLTAALYMLFNGIAPVVWASFSENFKIRRFLFLVAMIIYISASIGAVFVKNIWALVVVRCIQSIGVSCGQSIGAGYITDLYPIEQRGSAFGQYMSGVMIGPIIGPIVGGFLILSPIEWRASFWFCFAFGIMMFLVIFFFIPETFRDDAKYDQKLPTTVDDTISEETPESDDEKIASDNDSTASTVIESSSEGEVNKHKLDEEKPTKIEKEQVERKKKRKCFNPFAPYALLRHPFVILPSVAAGLSFGALFATQVILPNAFDEIYGLSSWKTGLTYIGGGLGNICGAKVTNYLSDKLLLRARRLRGGAAESEDRITANVWFAGLIFNPLGILLFGWIVQYHLNIWGAIIGYGIQCFGNVQVVTIVTVYLVDSLPGRSAAATAIVNFVRFLFACILTIVSEPMVAALGSGYTCTLFMGLAYLAMVLIFIMKSRGRTIRKWSGY